MTIPDALPPVPPLFSHEWWDAEHEAGMEGHRRWKEGLRAEFQAPLRADLVLAVKRLLRIRRSADHYYEAGNKHRHLKAIREESTRTASALVARHPWIAEQLNAKALAEFERQAELLRHEEEP